MLEQPTRRLGPVLIAFLVALAAAAGTVGYFGARRVLGIGEPTTSTTSDGTGQPPGTTSPDSTPPDNQPDSDEPTAPTVTQAEPKPPVTVPPGDPNACPQHTRDSLAAAGLNADLTRVLYVRATLPNAAGAEVWICRNADGLWVYQGHRLTGPITNPDHSLLLAEGVRGTVEEIEGGYLATNESSGGSQTTYTVTRNTVTIINPGSQTTYTVVQAVP